MAEVPEFLRSVKQCLRVVNACVFIVIFLFLYNDYLRGALRAQAYSVRTLEVSSASPQHSLPQSSFLGHKDGDILGDPVTLPSN